MMIWKYILLQFHSWGEMVQFASQKQANVDEPITSYDVRWNTRTRAHCKWKKQHSKMPIFHPIELDS